MTWLRTVLSFRFVTAPLSSPVVVMNWYCVDGAKDANEEESLAAGPGEVELVAERLSGVAPVLKIANGISADIFGYFSLFLIFFFVNLFNCKLCFLADISQDQAT